MTPPVTTIYFKLSFPSGLLQSLYLMYVISDIENVLFQTTFAKSLTVAEQFRQGLRRGISVL